MTDQPAANPGRHSVSRRDFLAVGGLSVVGLPAAEQAAVLRAQERSGPRSVIFVVMNGGPSQLETFDPKPDAPSHVRGPLRAIDTQIPGVHFSEAFPRLAERSDRLCVIRSLYHTAAPLHATGMQLLLTGNVARMGVSSPSLGSAAARLIGPRNGISPYVLAPEPVEQIGTSADFGEGAGWLGDDFHPVVLRASETAKNHGSNGRPAVFAEDFDRARPVVRDDYGDTDFGRRLWQAARLVEAGVRVVTVHLCPRLHGEVTWDAHAHKTAAPATLFDYRDTLGPRFDRAAAALIDDLGRTGLIDETLVICTGEFGRAPRLNVNGGRDHWPHCWSAIVAGAGTAGGTVIGASDHLAESPTDDPVEVSSLVASAYQSLRLDPGTTVTVNDKEHSLLNASPLPNLFAAT